MDDVAIKDDEVEQVLDEFNFLGVGENDAEWNPNKHILNEKRERVPSDFCSAQTSIYGRGALSWYVRV